MRTAVVCAIVIVILIMAIGVLHGLAFVPDALFGWH
jgi:hypothetical protein